MGSLLLVLTPIALLDSTSIVPLCFVPLVALLGGPRPIAKATAFLAGIFVSYYACGVALTLGVDALFERLSAWFEHIWKHPDTIDLLLQIAIGAVMVGYGWRLATARQSHGDRGLSLDVSAWQAFAGAVALTVVGLPGALPYFAAVDQILRADPDTVGAVLALGWYNAVFIAPLALVVVLRSALGSRSDRFLQASNAFLEKWGRRVIIAILAVLGAALVVDGVGWLLGMPLFPTPT